MGREKSIFDVQDVDQRSVSVHCKVRDVSHPVPGHFLGHSKWPELEGAEFGSANKIDLEMYSRYLHILYILLVREWEEIIG